MCGICGQFNFRDGAPVGAETIARMMDTITHRGPDDSGCHFSGSLGLGFRRLSIIDLSAGHQPMSDAEETTWVVFNGEIYNFGELRSVLAAHGHVFRTRCDTEVIVHGYKQWGTEVFSRLNGMFGLAIWDETRRRLVLARDAMGIKPLYYMIKDGTLFFGSEIRPILAGMGGRPAADPMSVGLFLQYRYTPAPFTAYQGIRKLASGEMLVVENGAAEASRWYRFEPLPFSPLPSDEEAGESLLSVYKDAVERHLISDVPVGLLLSGGIDSCLLLALMGAHGDRWRTYTVGYGESYSDDELEDAHESARLFSAAHSSVRIDRAVFDEALPRIIGVLEEPIASSSIVPMYFVCQRARHDVKVALVGQGPDELFGGYTRHLGVRYGSYWRGMPNMIRSVVADGLEKFSRRESLRRGTYALGAADRMVRYQSIFSIASATTIRELFRDGVLQASPENMILDCWADLKYMVEKMDELGGFQLLELRSALPDEILMYSDKMSMIHGLEVRVPYLDREVVEFVQRLGANFKVRNGARKWLHRQVSRKLLPDSIIRRKKRGFAVNVVDAWFRDSVAATSRDLLLNEESLMYNFLRPDATRSLLEAHVSGRSDNHKILFSLVMLESWLRSDLIGSVSRPVYP